ncbi:phage tail assembly chaperone [Clostridium paraputrificum]|uniref:phage tail assembly chaperone n=1 Tax=Clostridium paraputrificum TaxID=29363 RepID=UPI003D34693A
MSAILEFLTENIIEGLTEEVIVSERFKDKKGNLLKFKVKAVSPEEFSEIQKQCTVTKKKGKVDFNSKKFNELIAINYTVDPNFKDAESIKKLGLVTPEQFLNKTLLAGELSTLVEVISNLSGFDQDLDELRDEAKN